MDTRKEEFFAYVSVKVNIKVPESVKDDFNLWYDEYKSDIENKLDELGYDLSSIIDIFLEDDYISYVFKTDEVVKISESEFRGYSLSAGDNIIFSRNTLKNALVKEFGDDCYDTVYKIYNVIHDDSEDRICYYIQCLVSGEEINIDCFTEE